MKGNFRTSLGVRHFLTGYAHSDPTRFHNCQIAGYLDHEIFLPQKAFQQVEDERSGCRSRKFENHQAGILSRRIIANV
jgi:hypothetical protein